MVAFQVLRQVDKPGGRSGSRRSSNFGSSMDKLSGVHISLSFRMSWATRKFCYNTSRSADSVAIDWWRGDCERWVLWNITVITSNLLQFNERTLGKFSQEPEKVKRTMIVLKPFFIQCNHFSLSKFEQPN